MAKIFNLTDFSKLTEKSNIIILNKTDYEEFMDFLKVDMKKYGHEEDWKGIKAELDKNKNHKMIIKVSVNKRLEKIMSLNIGINSFCDIIDTNNAYQINRILNEMPNEFYDLIIYTAFD